MELEKRGLSQELDVIQGFPSTQSLSPHPTGNRVQVSSYWSKSPEIWDQAGFISFKRVHFLVPALLPPLQRGAVLEQEGLAWVLNICQIMGCCHQPRVRDPDFFGCSPCESTKNDCLHLVQSPSSAKVHSVSRSWALRPILVWSSAARQAGLGWSLRMCWGANCGDLAADRNRVSSDELPV